MSTIRVTLNEDAQSLIHAAAKDNSRPVLQTVCIRDSKAIAAEKPGVSASSCTGITSMRK